MNQPSICVGAYAKYNNGSIFGEWIDLTQFSDIEEFYDYCKELHKDEGDLELMFQDYENFPEGYICECRLNPAIFDVPEEFATNEYDDFCNFVSYFGKDATFEDFRNFYVGRYDSK